MGRDGLNMDGEQVSMRGRESDGGVHRLKTEIFDRYHLTKLNFYIFFVKETLLNKILSHDGFNLTPNLI